MNKLLKSARALWIRAQLAAPPSVRDRVLPLLRDAIDVARQVARPYLPVYELSGQRDGGPMTVTFVNPKVGASALKGLLFGDTPEERQAGYASFWRWRDLPSWPSGDIIIVQGGWEIIRRLPREGALVLPGSVNHILDLSGDWPTVEGRIHRKLLKSLRKQMQKNDYEFSVSHDERDFDEFYRQMYQPTMHDRHGEESQPVSRYEAREYFRRGYLFRVKRDGSWVAGAINHPEGSTLLGRMLGIRDADAEETKRGVAPALYYAVIRSAHENGYRAIDLLETGPLMEGLFQFKRRWGTTIGVSPRVRRGLWIKVRRATPAVISFLKEYPFVIIDENGRLHGLIAVDDQTQVTTEAQRVLANRYATPGLDSLIIRSVGSFAQPERADLVLPATISRAHA